MASNEGLSSPFVERDVADTCAFLHRFMAGERGFTSKDAIAGLHRLADLQGHLRDPERRRESREIAQRVCEKLDLRGPRFDWVQV